MIPWQRFQNIVYHVVFLKSNNLEITACVRTNPEIYDLWSGVKTFEKSRTVIYFILVLTRIMKWQARSYLWTVKGREVMEVEVAKITHLEIRNKGLTRTPIREILAQLQQKPLHRLRKFQTYLKYFAV